MNLSLPSPAKDPLLAIAITITHVLRILSLAVGSIIAIILPVIWLNTAKISVEMAKEGLAATATDLLPPLTLTLLLVIAAIYCAWRFLTKLLAIMHSVQQGDPFIAANADRLRDMGWTVIAMNLLGFAMGAAMLWIGRIIPDTDQDVSFGISGLFLALLLFILARVFRHGAAMRSDLEGTV